MLLVPAHDVVGRGVPSLLMVWVWRLPLYQRLAGAPVWAVAIQVSIAAKVVTIAARTIQVLWFNILLACLRELTSE